MFHLGISLLFRSAFRTPHHLRKQVVSPGPPATWLVLRLPCFWEFLFFVCSFFFFRPTPLFFACRVSDFVLLRAVFVPCSPSVACTPWFYLRCFFGPWLSWKVVWSSLMKRFLSRHPNPPKPFFILESVHLPFPSCTLF